MAIGDVVNGIALVQPGEYLNMKPAAGIEWVIHNITFGGAAEIYYTDGTIEVKFDAEEAWGGRMGFVYHCTNTKYYRVKNASASAIVIGFDGVQTK